MSEYMEFCLGEGKYERKGIGYQNNHMIFNKQLTKEEWSKVSNSLPTIKLQVTKWIDKDDMTKQEKKDISVWKELGGYLKRYSYEDAWENWIDGASKEDKEAILNCGYYDAEIFEGITGHKLELDDKVEIIVEGKKTMISRESAEALNLI